VDVRICGCADLRISKFEDLRFEDLQKTVPIDPQIDYEILRFSDLHSPDPQILKSTDPQLP
jgi:hypothetical protein